MPEEVLKPLKLGYVMSLSDRLREPANLVAKTLGQARLRGYRLDMQEYSEKVATDRQCLKRSR